MPFIFFQKNRAPLPPPRVWGAGLGGGDVSAAPRPQRGTEKEDAAGVLFFALPGAFAACGRRKGLRAHSSAHRISFATGV